MELGTLTFHRFNGEEVFRVSEATIRASYEGDEVTLLLYVGTHRQPLKTLPDTASLRAWPNAEVTIHVPRAQLGSLVGHRFSVPKSYDETIEDHVSCIYYCEHGDLDNNEISFLDRRDDAIRVLWTGTMPDVNHYDGSRPDTHVVIDSWFAFAVTGDSADA